MTDNFNALLFQFCAAAAAAADDDDDGTRLASVASPFIHYGSLSSLSWDITTEKHCTFIAVLCE